MIFVFLCLPMRIYCEHGTDKIDEGLFTTYCWIHGSKKIAKNYQKHFECKANVVRYFSGWMLPNFFMVAKFIFKTQI